MDFTAISDCLERECEFPADRATLIDTLDDATIETPVAAEECVATVLERSTQTTFQSHHDVLATLRGTVGAAYVGRRRYDDRSGVRPDPADRQPVSM